MPVCTNKQIILYNNWIAVYCKSFLPLDSVLHYLLVIFKNIADRCTTINGWDRCTVECLNRCTIDCCDRCTIDCYSNGRKKAQVETLLDERFINLK